MTEYGTIQERVARGAEWLRENGSKYSLDLSRVNLDNLDVGSTYSCILAQARGAYFGEVTSDLQEDDVFPAGMRWQWATHHAFSCYHGPADDLPCDAPELGAEWKRVITEQRAADELTQITQDLGVEA